MDDMRKRRTERRRQRRCGNGQQAVVHRVMVCAARNGGCGHGPRGHRKQGGSR